MYSELVEKYHDGMSNEEFESLLSKDTVYNVDIEFEDEDTGEKEELKYSLEMSNIQHSFGVESIYFQHYLFDIWAEKFSNRKVEELKGELKQIKVHFVCVDTNNTKDTYDKISTFPVDSVQEAKAMYEESYNRFAPNNIIKQISELD